MNEHIDYDPSAFWSCPNGCDDKVSWDVGCHVVTCDQCGLSEDLWDIYYVQDDEVMRGVGE